MSDMSTLRKWIGGYKLIRASKSLDTSWGEPVPATMLTYRSRVGKLATKYIDGWHTYEELTGSNTRKGEKT